MVFCMSSYWPPTFFERSRGNEGLLLSFYSLQSSIFFDCGQPVPFWIWLPVFEGIWLFWALPALPCLSILSLIYFKFHTLSWIQSLHFVYFLVLLAKTWLFPNKQQGAVCSELQAKIFRNSNNKWSLFNTRNFNKDHVISTCYSRLFIK